jgi:hypothetical protein
MGTLVKMSALSYLIGVKVSSQFLYAMVIIYTATLFLVLQQIYIETLPVK